MNQLSNTLFHSVESCQRLEKLNMVFSCLALGISEKSVAVKHALTLKKHWVTFEIPKNFSVICFEVLFSNLSSLYNLDRYVNRIF